MKSNNSSSNEVYSKCSFYKPYLSFLQKKKPPTTDNAAKVQFFIDTAQSGIIFVFYKVSQYINSN